MSEEIKIKKSDLWKYSTFLLIAIVIVGGFFMFNGKSSSNTQQNNNANNGGTTGNAAVDLSTFLNNDNLYPSIGPKNAAHTVVEFSDFQCPYCALAFGKANWTKPYASQYSDLIGSASMVEDLAKAGKIRFVYVPMSFLGQESVDAAQAALCANDQGKFWEYHDALFYANDGKEGDGTFTKANLKTLATSINGLDTTKFDSCLDNDNKLSDVRTIAAAASKAASGTPTFYVDGVKMGASNQQISAALA